jgi:hypothetical protein
MFLGQTTAQGPEHSVRCRQVVVVRIRGTFIDYAISIKNAGRRYSDVVVSSGMTVFPSKCIFCVNESL